MSKQKIFLEIGSSDFDTLLPLARRGWKGCIVEPIPLYAAKLRDAVEEEGLPVRVIEAAITTHDGEAEMYECLSRDRQWTRGISHMVEQSGTKLLDLAGNQHLKKRKITVRALRLDTLLSEICWPRNSEYQPIDFMKVDIEGHEMDILKSHTWETHPTMIKIEHKHCDDLEMKRILEYQGYTVWTATDDIYAIR